MNKTKNCLQNLPFSFLFTVHLFLFIYFFFTVLGHCIQTPRSTRTHSLYFFKLFFWIFPFPFNVPLFNSFLPLLYITIFSLLFLFLFLFVFSSPVLLSLLLLQGNPTFFFSSFCHWILCCNFQPLTSFIIHCAFLDPIFKHMLLFF